MALTLPPIKVGIQIPDPDKGDGGGYTFTSSIFNEIVKNRECDEQVVFRFIATSKPELRAGLHHWNLDSSDIIPLIPSRLSRIRAGLERFIDKPIRRITSSRSHLSLRSKREAEILGRELDLLWSLNPDPLSIEIPYAITVWDLQHRLQPYFPEVSRFGIWADREEWYNQRTRRASLLFTGTRRGKMELQRFYGIDSVRIAINPMPVSSRYLENSITNKNTTSLALPSSYIFYPANFWPHKNHYNLIRAIQLLHQSNQAIHLVLTGNDRYGHRAKVSNFAKAMGVGQAIIDMGHVDSKELLAIYKNAKALCFPSFFGPDNLPPLEAMALGIPAIVSDVKGAKEQLGDAAHYFNANDPHDIAAAINNILTNQALRNNLVKKGFKLANERTTAAYVQKALANIKKLSSGLHANLHFMPTDK